jgi:hypothetical protein
MKFFLQSILLITGISALYGGGQLLRFQDGNGLSINMALLQYSPFEDFFVPGLFLFGVIGFGSVAVFITGVLRIWFYGRASKMLGILILLWLIIQILSIRTFSWLQVVSALFGLAMILLPRHIRKYSV